VQNPVKQAGRRDVVENVILIDSLVMQQCLLSCMYYNFWTRYQPNISRLFLCEIIRDINLFSDWPFSNQASAKDIDH
jgi:hypothetical protein